MCHLELITYPEQEVEKKKEFHFELSESYDGFGVGGRDRDESG